MQIPLLTLGPGVNAYALAFVRAPSPEVYEQVRP